MKKSMINQVHLEGRIFSHDLVIKTVQNSESANFGKEFISGNIEIAVDEEGLNVVPVHFTYVTETTKSGAKSPTYTALKKIIDDNKTWSVVGKDAAQKIQVNSALGLNDFYNNNDELVSAKVNEGGFVTLLPDNAELRPEKERNTFNTDMVITSVKRIEKATKSTTGKINAELNEDKKIGILEENNSHGIFGELYDTNNKDLIEMQTASRYEINKGHAEILINFYGKGTQRYDVEIEKINYLHQNQNIKLKITSEDLIKKTGGIVQGMSGTPIIQNNKIIGAINYVSKNNSCECYGIFIDKLL